MNQIVKTHAQNIVAIAKSSEGFAKNEGFAVGIGGIPVEHLFTLSDNSDDSTFAYTCLVQNVEMALDIIEEAHKLLAANFNRDLASEIFSKLIYDFDPNQPIYLHYTKYIGGDIPT
ncbi:hypothetical protein [Chryseobacterium mucoviscidosis]|uniref:hypothetical protein n=1 Tax=Chryseobacterium mucoviscidosis TaxID=1945581 RepID=UPI0031D71176